MIEWNSKKGKEINYDGISCWLNPFICNFSKQSIVFSNLIRSNLLKNNVIMIKIELISFLRFKRHMFPWFLSRFQKTNHQKRIFKVFKACNYRKWKIRKVIFQKKIFGCKKVVNITLSHKMRSKKIAIKLYFKELKWKSEITLKDLYCMSVVLERTIYVFVSRCQQKQKQKERSNWSWKK